MIISVAQWGRFPGLDIDVMPTCFRLLIAEVSPSCELVMQNIVTLRY